MAKNPKITTGIVFLIEKIWLEKQGAIAEDIRKELHKRLLNPNENKGIELDTNRLLLVKGGEWPGLSAVQKELKAIRERHKTVLPIDKPWNILSLSNYPIPPEAVPLVMAIARNYNGVTYKHKLIIREAKWIGMLYGFVPEDERGDYIILHELLVWAEHYANMERYKDTSGKEPSLHDVEGMDDDIDLLSRVMSGIRETTEINVKYRENFANRYNIVKAMEAQHERVNKRKE